MHWGYPAFSGRAKLFADQLDLSEAADLIRECESECPWYGEVIANRKAAIRYLASGFIGSAGGQVQVLIPAAGWSPLALELLEMHPGVSAVIELDLAGMEGKHRLYRTTAPDLADRIRCVTADISAPDALTGYIPDRGLPVLVIMEGITYFMDPGWVERFIRTWPGKPGTGYVIEYLLPADEMKPESCHIADHVFSVVAAACSCPPPVRYSPGRIREIAGRYGYAETTLMNVTEMERLRTGTNRYFCGERDGWIAVTAIR
jgi:hypothetical protein